MEVFPTVQRPIGPYTILSDFRVSPNLKTCQAFFLPAHKISRQAGSLNNR